MHRRLAYWPHLVQDDGNPGARHLPSRLTPGRAAANHMDRSKFLTPRHLPKLLSSLRSAIRALRARLIKRRAIQKIMRDQCKPRPHDVSGPDPVMGSVINAVLVARVVMRRGL